MWYIDTDETGKGAVRLQQQGLNSQAKAMQIAEEACLATFPGSEEWGLTWVTSEVDSVLRVNPDFAYKITRAVQIANREPQEPQDLDAELGAGGIQLVFGRVAVNSGQRNLPRTSRPMRPRGLR